MINRRVVVTGVGAVSALGSTADELWEGALHSRPGIKRYQRFVDAGLSVTVGGDVDFISTDDADRPEQIANCAIDEALKQAGIKRQDSGIFWSTGLDNFDYGNGGLTRSATGTSFSALCASFANPRRMIATACASGTQAIGAAFHIIRNGGNEICLAGGSSAMLSPFYLIGFAGIQALALDDTFDNPATACRPFDKTRSGFALANGAGALVLESIDHALERDAVILGEVVGFGMSQDAFDLNRPSPEGEGAALSIQRAFLDARISPEDVNAVNAHGTGTILGDIAETRALRKVFAHHWVRLPVSSLKGAIGHAQSAAGALEAIVALRTCMTGVVPPTLNLHDVDEACMLDHVMLKPRVTGAETVLSSSFAMGGQNASVIFRKYTS